MSYKRWLVIAVVLFVIGIIIGTVTPADARVARDLTLGLKELSGILIPFSPLTAFIIFVKNVLAMLLSFMFSPILCFVPIFSLMLNGWLLGFVSELAIEQESLGYVLVGVLPHGIFELPALIIAQAAALGAGTAITLAVFQKKRRATLVTKLSQYVKYLVLAFILLLPAALIETFVTPLLVGR